MTHVAVRNIVLIAAQKMLEKKGMSCCLLSLGLREVSCTTIHCHDYNSKLICSGVMLCFLRHSSRSFSVLSYPLFLLQMCLFLIMREAK